MKLSSLGFALGALLASFVFAKTPTELKDAAQAAGSPKKQVTLSRDHQWPAWRGPAATGVAAHAKPPTEWSESKNVRWKVPIPGLGHSTPVVWGDTVFLTAAVPYGPKLPPKPDTAPGAHDNSPVTQRHRFIAMAIRRTDGTVRWKKTCTELLPHEGGHYTGSLASQSPVTDGELFFAYFGSRGLYCFDATGEEKWRKDLGRMQTKHAHGEGSSPVLHEDGIAINWDHEGKSFVALYDKTTGKERWKVARDVVTSWATPIVVEHGGKDQLIVSATPNLVSYDVSNGKVLWECGGLSHNVVASPVSAGGMVFAGSSYEKRYLFAMSLDGAKGDITGTKNIVWSRTRSTPYVPSPLLYRGGLYFLRHYQGILSRVDARTGAEPSGPFRLERMREIYASPVAADGKIFITDRLGITIVMSADENPRFLGRNRLADRINASLALVDREIFIRGERYLYCIGAK
ncbi:MAG: PQQ-binding-like beta-propeller repeat protein [Planctomycetota bacterium]